jgi:hypothetical protein
MDGQLGARSRPWGFLLSKGLPRPSRHKLLACCPVIKTAQSPGRGVPMIMYVTWFDEVALVLWDNRRCERDARSCPPAEFRAAVAPDRRSRLKCCACPSRSMQSSVRPDACSGRQRQTAAAYLGTTELRLAGRNVAEAVGGGDEQRCRPLDPKEPCLAEPWHAGGRSPRARGRHAASEIGTNPGMEPAA